MAKRTDIMPLFLEACPSFEGRWLKFLESWHGQEPPLYVSLSEFAEHLLDLIRKDRTGEMPSVFEVVEKFHVDGDPDVKEAVLVGLLERLQDIADEAAMDPALVVRFLKPVSAEWWKSSNG